ncbi:MULTISPECIES: hypothetical protein [Catenuloplanes]|uniref:Uncharacterized protein n=1 Tax=Catenuloplanes niger TaxID=587534 RepID=A0AAE3ZS44_9ACTN|nr:hypothetical protein [Catenuloplanes niger]MDR7323765.1 hypothetical protein [Catenuloplanes niger]
MAGIDLTALIAASRVLLLDFDGPVCGLFAGHPAAGIATALRRLLVERGVPVVPDESDPMEVLRYAATLGRPALTREVEDALCAAELVAARSAEPTPYARELLVAAHRTGRRSSPTTPPPPAVPISPVRSWSVSCIRSSAGRTPIPRA